MSGSSANAVGGVGGLAAVLWRQRVLLLAALVVIGTGLAVGWHLAPRDYDARTTLTFIGDPSVEVDATDIDGIGSELASSARSKPTLADVVDRLGLDRSAADLQDEVAAHWESQDEQVVIEVHDGDEDVARGVAQELADVLAEHPILGIVGFRSAPAASVIAHEYPATWLGAVLSVLVAMIVTVLLASWRDGRTNTVTGAADVETALTAPVLAHVRMPRDPTVLPVLVPGAAAADPFRHVRAALGVTGRRVDHVVAGSATEDAHLDSPATARLVVSSSPVGGPAPAWVATNLALALAQDGWQVMLVDARLGARFGRPKTGEPPGPGLLDVLDGVPLAEALHPGPIPGLSVMSAGTRGDPSDLLSAERFAAVAAEAQRLVDVVVLITPALDVCDDALMMATPGTLLLSVPEGRVSLVTLRAEGIRVRATVPRLLGSVLVGRPSERASV